MVKSVHLDAELRGQFCENLHNDIIPFMRAEEAGRLRRLWLLIILGAIAIPIYLIIFKLNYGTQSYKAELQTCACIVCYGIVIYSLVKKKFENRLKKIVMPIILKTFGDFQWSQESSISKAFLSDTKLFGKFTSKVDDDNFKGTYHDLSVAISETTLSIGNAKNGTDRFKGLVAVTDMNKYFHGKTIIVPNNAKWLNGDKLRGLDKVLLEDPEFEELYCVYSNDQVEARYLLTPTFIERYKNIKKVFKTDKIRCAFINNKILIAIESRKDFFNIASLFRPLTDIKQFSVLFEEFASILTLIDVLKLNTKIGL